MRSERLALKLVWTMEFSQNDAVIKLRKRLRYWRINSVGSE